MDAGYNNDLEDSSDDVKDSLIDIHRDDEVPEDDVLQMDEDIHLGSPLWCDLISIVPIVGSQNIQAAQNNAPLSKKRAVDWLF